MTAKDATARHIARLRQRAREVLGNDDLAETWLTGRIPALDNRIPIELAWSKSGAWEAEAILARIEHGVFS